MCLIIQKRANQKVTEAFVRNVFSLNPDGWGVISYKRATGGRRARRRYVDLTLAKGLDIESAVEHIKWLNNEGRTAMIHFRKKTHGVVDTENLHPFPITDDMWLFHNGTIVGIPLTVKDRSDTWHFCHELLRPMILCHPSPEKFVRTDHFRFLMSKFTSASNRLAIVDRQGIIIYGDKDKEWTKTTDDLLVSNSYAYTINKVTPPMYSPYGRMGGTYNYGSLTPNQQPSSSLTTPASGAKINRFGLIDVKNAEDAWLYLETYCGYTKDEIRKVISDHSLPIPYFGSAEAYRNWCERIDKLCMKVSPITGETIEMDPETERTLACGYGDDRGRFGYDY